MDVNKVLKDIGERHLKEAEISEIGRNLILDIGNLTAHDKEDITLPKAGPQRDSFFKKLAQDDVQAMLNKLYSLDTEVVDGEKVIRLPEPSTILPRARPVPKPKQPTKWERFAREKGIKSKSSNNREKLNYDETTDKWVPRYGYNKVKNDNERDWVIEIPDQADPNVDYFAKKQEDKKERIAKNKFQQLRNKAAAL